MDHRLVCDGGGLPLTAVVTAANVADTTMFQAVLDDVPPMLTPSGRRRTRPGTVHADKEYDHRRCRRYLAGRRITSRIARRGMESSTRLGRHRWKVERSLAWLLANRRLTVRHERRGDLMTAFPHLACRLVCARKLPPL